MMQIWKDFRFAYLSTIIHLFLFAVLIYNRMLTTVHVSLIGQYFELSPLFAVPFMVIFRLYGPSHWFIHTLFLIFIHIIYIILTVFVRKALKNSAFRIFSGFIYADSSSAVMMSKFTILKLSSSIRLIAKYNSNPEVLNRFLEYQRKIRLRTSSFIEICRFLILFPEYRSLMYEQVSSYSTKSTHNRFILFMFQTFLEAINSPMLPNVYVEQLEMYYKSIISHSYLYWNARKDKKFGKAFFESFATAYLIGEVKYLMYGLMYIYPFNPVLHKYYAEMLLMIDGKFDDYKKEMLFSIQLEKKDSFVFDPLLNVIISQNPKILQYCHPGHLSHSNSASDFNSAYSTSFFIKPKKPKKKKEKKKKSVASMIVRSKRKIPYFHILNYILPLLFTLVFVFFSNALNERQINQSKKLFGTMGSTQKSFYSIVSSISILLSVKNSSFHNLKTESDCQIGFFNVTKMIYHYYSNSPFISNISYSVFLIAFHEMKNLALRSHSVCHIVKNLNMYLFNNTDTHFKYVYQNNQQYLHYFEEVYKNEESLFHIVPFVCYGSIFVVIFLIIYFTTTCITLNKIMKDNQNAIDYLSSEKRLSPAFQNPDSRENKWSVCNGIEISMNYSDSLPHDYESEMENTSHLPPSIRRNEHSSPKSRLVRSTVQVMDPHSPDSTSILSNKNNNNLSVDFSEKMPINNRKKLGIKNSVLSGSATSMRRQQRVFVPKNNLYLTKSNDDSIIVDSNATSSAKSTENDSDNFFSMYHDSNQKTNISIDDKLAFIEESKKETLKFSLQSIFFSVLLPWICIYILVLVGYYPLITRRKSDFDHGKEIFFTAKDYSNALLLLSETLRLYYLNEIDVKKYVSVDDYYTQNYTIFSEKYYETKCMELTQNTCFSVRSIVRQIIDNDYEESFLESIALPMFMNFTETALNNMHMETRIDLFQLMSSAGSFIAMVVTYGILFVAFGYKNYKTLKKGLNSLFHFPGSEVQIVDKNANNQIKLNGNETNSSVNVTCSLTIDSINTSTDVNQINDSNNSNTNNNNNENSNNLNNNNNSTLNNNNNNLNSNNNINDSNSHNNNGNANSINNNSNLNLSNTNSINNNSSINNINSNSNLNLSNTNSINNSNISLSNTNSINNINNNSNLNLSNTNSINNSNISLSKTNSINNINNNSNLNLSNTNSINNSNISLSNTNSINNINNSNLNLSNTNSINNSNISLSNMNSINNNSNISISSNLNSTFTNSAIISSDASPSAPFLRRRSSRSSIILADPSSALQPHRADSDASLTARFPSNVMIVTSVAETDEIYSISDTCLQIVNKRPSDFICRKLSRVFPVVKLASDLDVREHNGKVFIAKTKTIGKLSKTVLIESSKAELKAKSTNVIQKLLNFMPLYFVKPFSEDFSNFFHFDRSVLIFVRVDAKVAGQLDNYFTIANRLDQSFFNVDFIRSNGSILSFICKEPDALEVVLFLRDLLASCEEACKRQTNNFALRSIFIGEINGLNVQIIEGSVEPESRIEEPEFFAMETMVLRVDTHCIGCSRGAAALMEETVKMERCAVRDGIRQITFETFKSEVANFG